jgi:Protein of unknown function (DUF995)
MNLSFLISLFTAVLLLLLSPPSSAQSLMFSEIQATGAKPLSAAEIRTLVSGAKTEFTQVNGGLRIWTNEPDGTFIASRNFGELRRRTGNGTWSINDDAALCLTFDWGAMQTESWCRQVYRVEDRHYLYGLDAKPDTRSGRYRFTK